MNGRAEPPVSPSERAALEREIRSLQERVAFYEGFDHLIQDNVAQARELFRLAAQEREAAAGVAERAHVAAGQREAVYRAELEALAAALSEIAATVESLSRRVAHVLADTPFDALPARTGSARQPVAVVVHGVPSARAALSLQRFVASLPQVDAVYDREFAGGVLRLDARVQDRLQVDQFRGWETTRRIQALTERDDVIEFALHDGLGERT
jgi:hypothetical protein